MLNPIFCFSSAKVFDLSPSFASGTDHVVDCSFVIYIYAIYICIHIYAHMQYAIYAHFQYTHMRKTKLNV